MPVPMKKKRRPLPDFNKDPVWQRLKEKMGIKPKKKDSNKRYACFILLLTIHHFLALK